MRGAEYLESRRKRVLDKSIAAVALTATLPLYGLMYLENKRRGQPLFFKQQRVGRDGESFEIWKFETLYQGAEREEEHIRQIYRDPTEKMADTRVPSKRMRFIRRLGLNEFPQVVNVFRGELSIAGPRPQSADYLKAAEEIFPDIMRDWKKTALTITPGVLGTAPLRTRGLSVAEFDKTAEADMDYFETATLLKDLKIIAQAILGFLR